MDSQNGSALKAKIRFKVLGNLSDKPLERELSDKKFRGFLVLANLSKSHSAWTISVGLFDCTVSRSSFSSGLGSELLSRGLAPSRLASCLLGTGHNVGVNQNVCDSVKFQRSFHSLLDSIM